MRKHPHTVLFFVPLLLVPSCLTPEFIFDGETNGDGDTSLAGSSGAIDPSCSDGKKNGSETDEDCGGTCSACGDEQRCAANQDCQSAKCVAGHCAAPTCEDRVKNGSESDIDCGGECEGCEPGQDCVVADDCLSPPVGDPATSSCEDGECVLMCAGGTDDCNSRADDGCEASLSTDVNHCGMCGVVCDPAHATAAKCQGGECLIDFDAGGCAGAWVDCNGEPEDGCEVNTNDDVDNCGDCNAACSDSHGAPRCDDGTCVSDCAPGYADCDDDVWSNGCEANTLSSVLTCGGCEASNVCPEGGPTESPYCDGGTCELADCPTGYGDCDGDTTCSDDLTTEDNCGSCGNPCGASNATTSCQDQGGGAYACEVSGCLGSGGAEYEDCDGLYANGCETNVLSDEDDCGGCAPGSGTNCAALEANSSLHINSMNCTSGDCVIAGCTTGYSDCDLNPNNGCEVNIRQDADRCGGCLPTDPKTGTGIDCSAQPNTTGECIDYACEIDQCALSFGTGCERQLTRVIFGTTSTVGTFLVTYNATNLVVSATITDANIYTTSDGGEPWDNDGIEIYIDLNNSKSGSIQSDDFQIRSTLGTNSASGIGSVSWGAVSISQNYGSSPYTITVTIPWAALGGASQPPAGTVIGFDLGINADNNGGARDAQLMMFGSDQNFNNPSLWGTLRLN